MGTQEFYSAVEDLPEIADSLVVHLEDTEGGLGELLMFVSLVPGIALDSGLRDTIRRTLRERLSPRYVPNEITDVPVIPRTITGKRLEVPVKRILSGVPPPSEVVGSIADSQALDPFIAMARSRRAASEGA